jgi:hypothetical protein
VVYGGNQMTMTCPTTANASVCTVLGRQKHGGPEKAKQAVDTVVGEADLLLAADRAIT